MRTADERGFTLIELMVVVLIIALLVAIAIPTYLGARRRAQDRQAHSHLRNGLVAEKGFYADGSEYTDEITALRQEESNLAWGNLDGGARGIQVEFLSDDAQALVLRSKSRSGALFCLADAARSGAFLAPYPISEGGTWYSSRNDGDDNCRFLLWETTSAGWE